MPAFLGPQDRGSRIRRRCSRLFVLGFGLGSQPGMSGAELAVQIVDDHVAHYGAKGNHGDPGADTSINFAAMTAFDLSYMDAVAAAHWHWAAVTYPLFDDLHNLLPHARDPRPRNEDQQGPCAEGTQFFSAS